MRGGFIFEAVVMDVFNVFMTFPQNFHVSKLLFNENLTL